MRSLRIEVNMQIRRTVMPGSRDGEFRLASRNAAR
jgi:hypothetical protein